MAMDKRDFQLIELSPNEFVDNTDWLGLLNEEGNVHDFMTVHSHSTRNEIISENDTE